MILFVGSNPSNAAQNLVPFTPDTVSGRVLSSWIEAAGVKEYAQTNILDVKTPSNRPLTIAEIRECIPKIQNICQGFTKIVSLGKTAHRALDIAGIEHLELSHPSGLNRKLNDKTYVEALINKLSNYAKE